MVKIMENPIKMDDLGVPLFLETPICARVDQLPWFPYNKGDGHQANSRGLYTHY